MATFIVKHTITNDIVTIVESTDADTAKLIGTDAGLEVGNVIINEYTESVKTEAKQIDQIEYEAV